MISELLELTKSNCAGFAAIKYARDLCLKDRKASLFLGVKHCLHWDFLIVQTNIRYS